MLKLIRRLLCLHVWQEPTLQPIFGAGNTATHLRVKTCQRCGKRRYIECIHQSLGGQSIGRK